jgi:uncharacterized protein (DUF1501 family)
VQPDRRFPGDAPALNAAFAALYRPTHGQSEIESAIAQVGGTALASSDKLRNAVKAYRSRVDYPKGAFGDQLRLVAQLSAAGLGAAVFHVTLGSFDTHANQKRQQATLLAQLAEGIDALLTDAEEHGFYEGLAIMTYSEFGRRVQENASGGTDHGAAGISLVAGAGVAGGLYGSPPNLAALEGGDLPVRTDFRSLYAAILRDWLGLPLAAALGNWREVLPLFKPAIAAAKKP